MKKPDQKSADILVLEAKNIALLASSAVLKANEDIRIRYGKDAERVWEEHLYERVLELSAALAAGKPEIFRERIEWSKTAMKARQLDPNDLDASMEGLKEAIEQVLGGSTRTACIAYLRDTKPTQPPTMAMPSPLDPGLAYDRLAIAYIQTVISGNVLQGMELILDAEAEGFNVSDLFVHVILPAQREVGRLWHINQISIAEEHLVSNTTQRLMAILAAKSTRRKDRGRTAMAASVAGNVHDIAIKTISYLLEFDGWRTIYLGPDTPKSELIHGISVYEIDVLLLSVGLSTQLRTLRETIQEIRKACKDDIKIIVGGNAFSGMENIWKELQADGFASNADQAIILADEFFPCS
jgi:methanogenic corrinoid protein MtbC1